MPSAVLIHRDRPSFSCAVGPRTCEYKVSLEAKSIVAPRGGSSVFDSTEQARHSSSPTSDSTRCRRRPRRRSTRNETFRSEFSARCSFARLCTSSCPAISSAWCTTDRIAVKAPIADALKQLGIGWAEALVSAGTLAGLTTVMLVLYYGLTRVDEKITGTFADVNRCHDGNPSVDTRCVRERARRLAV